MSNNSILIALFLISVFTLGCILWPNIKEFLKKKEINNSFTDALNRRSQVYKPPQIKENKIENKFISQLDIIDYHLLHFNSIYFRTDRLREAIWEVNSLLLKYPLFLNGNICDRVRKINSQIDDLNEEIDRKNEEVKYQFREHSGELDYLAYRLNMGLVSSKEDYAWVNKRIVCLNNMLNKPQLDKLTRLAYSRIL